MERKYSNINHRKTLLNTGNPTGAIGSGWSLNPNYELPTVFVEFSGVQGDYEESINHGELVDVNGDGLLDWVESYETCGPTVSQTWVNTGTGFPNSPDSDYAPP